MSWIFQECFKRALKKLQGYFKSAWKESFKCVPRKFPKCPKQVSRLFQGNFNNVSKVFQSNFKGVSRKFCFLILHGTHRSFPSRRRACSRMSKFQFENFENRGGGVSIFQKCPNINYFASILQYYLYKKCLKFKNIPI